MIAASDPLLRVLRQPELLPLLSLREWDRVLPMARSADLLGRLAAFAGESGYVGNAHVGPKWHLQASAVATAHNQRAIRWQIQDVERALAGVDAPVVLLKGAAYLMASLPPSRGRSCADVDILVKKEAIPEVEIALRLHGWKTEPIGPLDQKYFRATLHELPPMIHDRHEWELDVHHNILPATDTLHVETEKLMAASIPVAGGGRFRILSPCDMILHAAAHLFRNGRYAHGLRDLVDLDELQRHFSTAPDFWEQLIARAVELELTIPCYWSLRYVQRLFATPVPERITSIVRTWQPALPSQRVMDWLIEQAVLPHVHGANDLLRRLSHLILGYYPVPRLSIMATPLFWLKRVPWLNKTDETAQ